jgi:hypothetical protein
MPTESEFAVLFKNNSRQQVTVYFYHFWDFFCFISWYSKIIRPNQEFLQRGNYKFQYQIQLGGKDLKNDVKPWTKNLYIEINSSESIVEEDLDNNKIEKTIVFEHDKFVNSARINGEKDLYAILGLKMEDVRKMNLVAQTQVIQAAYTNSSMKHHPDRPGGNTKIMQEVNFANAVLKEPSKRVRYHNMLDKNGVGFSCLNPNKYWTQVAAIFWPEVSNEEEAKARLKGLKTRIWQISTSLGLFGLGTAASLLTGGLAYWPMLAVNALGFGTASAGMSSISRSFDEECKWENWGKSAAIGFVTGAVTGGVLGSMTDGVSVANMTAGEHVSMGGIAGSVGGLLQSVGSDIERNLLDGEKIGAAKILKNALCSAAIGAAVGAVGGSISGGAGGFLANTNVDEVAEAAVLRKAGTQGLQSFSESGVGTLLNLTRDVIEERLDSRVENKPLGQYATRVVGGLGKDVVCSGIRRYAVGIVSESITEEKYRAKSERMRDKFKESPEKIADSPKFHIYKEHLENSESNLQGKIRAEKFKKIQLTPKNAQKDPKYKLPECQASLNEFDSDSEKAKQNV